MHKSLKTLIASITISSLLFSSAVSVHALTADEAYTYAYKSTMDALSSKTQKSINKARESIKALNGTSASWAIGEFSSKVDSVQHPILVNIINSITLAQNTPNQRNINNARNTIDPELPIEWKSAYSSALDSVQQSLINEVLSIYKDACSSKDIQKISFTSIKLQNIKLSSDLNIVNWAKDFESKIIDQQFDSSLKKDILSLEDYVKLYLFLNHTNQDEINSLTQKQLETYKILNTKYNSTDPDLFTSNPLTIANPIYVEDFGLDVYISPYGYTNIHVPRFFINDTPIYEYSVMDKQRFMVLVSGDKHTVGTAEVYEAFNAGNLYHIVEGKKVKVTEKPFFRSWFVY